MPLIVPYANTPAGLVLTAQDYEEAGIQWLAFKFSILMVKPGMWLQHQPTLARLVAWPHSSILDLTQLTTNSKGDIVIRSPYDGSILRWSQQAIIDIVDALAPHHVLWPTWFKDKQGEGEVLVLGTDEIHFQHKEDAYCLTDAPLSKAQLGVILTDDGWLDIKAPENRLDTGLLGLSCECMTCKLQLTRQYLHHLYEHTPNLCYRYLAVHQLFQHLRQR